MYQPFAHSFTNIILTSLNVEYMHTLDSLQTFLPLFKLFTKYYLKG